MATPRGRSQRSFHASRLLLAIVAAVLGVAAEALAYDIDEVLLWLPDLLVGWAFLGAALVLVRPAAPGAVWLMAATGIAWFLGVFEETQMLHRGPLIHLLLTYPGWRPSSRIDLGAVVVAYGASLWAPLWHNELTTIALAWVLIVLSARRYAHSGGIDRADRLPPLRAAAAVGVVLLAGAVSRVAAPVDAVIPALLAYEVVLASTAVGLAVHLRRSRSSAVTDLVVELSEARSGTLAQTLARVLGDPGLRVGYWSPGSKSFVDDDGTPVEPPVSAVSGEEDREGMRAATFVARDGEPFAVLVHDAQLLADPALRQAVTAATRLAASNAELRSEVRRRLEDLTASRRRIVLAATEERERLESRLRRGPERQLDALESALRAAGGAPAADGSDPVAAAQAFLAATRKDLGELANGLHPRDLAETGLEGAIPALAARSGVPVRYSVTAGRLPRELEATVYFVCSEALANVAKHSRATAVDLEVAVEDGRLMVVISDDGIGGADPERGSGLRGLSDRVEALGGSADLLSTPRSGTRLAVSFPLRGEG